MPPLVLKIGDEVAYSRAFLRRTQDAHRGKLRGKITGFTQLAADKVLATVCWGADTNKVDVTNLMRRDKLVMVPA
jgi:hypothetical protein